MAKQAEADVHEIEFRTPPGALGVAATVHVGADAAPAGWYVEAIPNVLALATAKTAAVATKRRRTAEGDGDSRYANICSKSRPRPRNKGLAERIHIPRGRWSPEGRTSASG
jgi:hypothetical protein